jgi:acyl carrier protein
MMTLDEFFEHFREELDVVDLIDIDTSTIFVDIPGWDSVNALIIIAMIEEKFEVRLTSSDLEQSKSIEDLYNLIQKKLR